MCMGDARIDFANAKCTHLSLPVATLRRQRLSAPLSSITLSTYLPSGDVAARAALAYLWLA
jgi:hypothetical protein